MSSLSSNNVIYGFLVAPNVPDEETGEIDEVVIDSNKLARELILKQEEAYKAKLLEEERERRLAKMREAGEEVPEGMDPDEFLGLADSIMQKEEPESSIEFEQMLADANAEAERIIADANAQADEIINAAQLNADAMRNLANMGSEDKIKTAQLPYYYMYKIKFERAASVYLNKVKLNIAFHDAGTRRKEAVVLAVYLLDPELGKEWLDNMNNARLKDYRTTIDKMKTTEGIGVTFPGIVAPQIQADNNITEVKIKSGSVKTTNVNRIKH